MRTARKQADTTNRQQFCRVEFFSYLGATFLTVERPSTNGEEQDTAKKCRIRQVERHLSSREIAPGPITWRQIADDAKLSWKGLNCIATTLFIEKC
ncbi:hypothetical protein EVAR_36242_1 [Eumeta japonica]|uniref:Uncharacterized protein n=1 Tax=Eumeta variegata TaxID=151549 RepID=A0A4C1WZM0_EUMVA|nr:hypothetical protein EVAR_36242_1 [Eumeta japonica]